MQQNWFKNWFDSPYYHILYKHRDFSEAEFFITNLFNHLSLTKGAEVLDLACGKGRHARQIHNLGYTVKGIDLSPESIEAARLKEKKSLTFETGDMRNIPYQNKFDLVVNLFTSFGYFQQEGDNVKVITSITKTLKENGILVLDYLNVTKVKTTLPQSEEVIHDGITFKINKSIDNGFIIKSIDFEDKGNKYAYQEYVKLFDLSDFKKIFSENGLETISVFGDYKLSDFNEHKSDRLILIAKKK